VTSCFFLSMSISFLLLILRDFSPWQQWPAKEWWSSLGISAQNMAPWYAYYFKLKALGD
jgi:hypothetical protein